MIFLPSAHFDSLPWEPKCKKCRKNIFKIIFSETIWNIGLRLCRNILCISLYKFCVLLLLLKNSGCYGNLNLPWIYNGKIEKKAFIVKPLQIFWQNFYRNVPWVVLYQADNFSAQCSFWLVAMAAKIQKIKKNIFKNHLLRNHMEYRTETLQKYSLY